MRERTSPTSMSVGTPLLLVAVLLMAACTDPSAVSSPDAPSSTLGADGIGMFNPQPDPYRTILRFLIDTPELVDNPDLRPWTGIYVDSAGREFGLVVEHLLLPAVQQGRTLKLSQRWTFDGGESGLPAVQLDGLLNLQNGRLVLNGRAMDGGTVHVRGALMGGAGAIGGEVMFNPQPDPPKEQR